MTHKRIFVLNGHPAQTSLNRTLAQTYADSAREAGHEVRVTNLSDLNFDSDFEYAGYDRHKPLEPALEKVLEDIEWCDHLVMTSPMWWGGLPAKLKGLFDRALLPGRAFDTRVLKNGMPTPLLTGRSARVILTSDTPGWFMRFIYRNAMLRQIRGQILGFVGLKPSKFTYFAGASHPKDGKVAGWLSEVRRIGLAGA